MESITENQYGKDVGIVLRMVEDKDSQVTETDQVLSPYWQISDNKEVRTLRVTGQWGHSH